MKGLWLIESYTKFQGILQINSFLAIPIHVQSERVAECVQNPFQIGSLRTSHFVSNSKRKREAHLTLRACYESNSKGMITEPTYLFTNNFKS